MSAGNWDDYFDCRGVTTATYGVHQLPAYLRRELPENQDARIVDLGCGLGQNLRAISSLGYTHVSGVEPSKSACEYVRLQGGTVFHGTISEYAESCQNEAELVILTHVLEHLPKEEIIPTLSLVRTRILARTGRLFVAVPNASSPTHCYWRYEDWTHTCLFTAGSLLYVLKAAGFKEVTIVDADCLAGARWYLRPIKRFLLWAYRQWLFCIYKVTSTSLHAGSPVVLSYEVKATGRPE